MTTADRQRAALRILCRAALRRLQRKNPPDLRARRA